MEVTLDGSVDIRGQPALRRTTGGFKRAFFILGKTLSLPNGTFSCFNSDSSILFRNYIISGKTR